MHAGNRSITFLLDGPLMDPRARRADLVARMAKDLVTFEAAHNEADAIRSLMARGYSPFDVLRLVPEARALAFQEIVAAEMSKS